MKVEAPEHYNNGRNYRCLTPEPQITNILTIALTKDV